MHHPRGDRTRGRDQELTRPAQVHHDLEQLEPVDHLVRDADHAVRGHERLLGQDALGELARVDGHVREALEHVVLDRVTVAAVAVHALARGPLGLELVLQRPRHDRVVPGPAQHEDPPVGADHLDRALDFGRAQVLELPVDGQHPLVLRGIAQCRAQARRQLGEALVLTLHLAQVAQVHGVVGDHEHVVEVVVHDSGHLHHARHLHDLDALTSRELARSTHGRDLALVVDQDLLNPELAGIQGQEPSAVESHLCYLLASLTLFSLRIAHRALRDMRQVKGGLNSKP